MVPSLSQAESYLAEGSRRNPGPWVSHSRFAAQAMSNLARALLNQKSADPRYADLDPDRAYVLGLLHDIGRREGVFGMRHIVDGYRFLEAQGYPSAGRVCLTHSFPDKTWIAGASGWDGTPAELEFVRDYIQGLEYTIYDRLVQLADAVCLPGGFVLMEMRMVDVALRYGMGTNAPISHFVRRWKAFFAIKEEIEKDINDSIYTYLPGVVENTFDFSQPIG